jgi:hypothetical protein
MAVRTLDQIIGELGSVYNPQIKTIEQQKALVGQGVEADITQAKAEQGQAYEDILGGARRRGLGFSGIPLGEQAKYASTVFAPQVLRARQQGRQQELSLTDALNQIYEKRRQYADTLRSGDIAQDQWNQTFAFEKEKWAETLRQQAADRAAAARAAASGYSGGYVGGGTPASAGGNTGAVTKVKPADQSLFNSMFIKGDGNKWDDNALRSDYAATLKSARYGNAKDRQKVLFYHSFRPDLFGSNVPGAVLSNAYNTRNNSTRLYF